MLPITLGVPSIPLSSTPIVEHTSHIHRTALITRASRHVRYPQPLVETRTHHGIQSVQAHGSLLLPGSIWYCYLGGRLLVLQDFDGQKSLSGEQFTHNAPTIPCRATNRFRTPSLRPRTVAQLRLSYCEWFMVPMAARFLSHTLRARHLVLRSCFQSSSSPRQLSSGIL